MMLQKQLIVHYETFVLLYASYLLSFFFKHVNSSGKCIKLLTYKKRIRVYTNIVMKMKWDATLVTSFEGLSQYPKFLNSEGQWTKCSPAHTIRLNNHVVVDMADVRNNVKVWVMKNRLFDCSVDQHWLRLPNKSMNDPFLIAKRIRRRLDIVCLFSLIRYKTTFSC